MSLIVADTGGSDFEISPAGTHLARCYLLADLGHQKTNYQGITSVKQQVLISWELVNEKMEDGRPFVISRTYTASLGEKSNLRADLEAWRSKAFSEQEIEGFDLKNILAAPCQVTVVHNEKKNKTYANVKAVTAIPKGTNVPELHNDPVAYEIHDEIAFSKLPEWIQNKIKNRVEVTQGGEGHSETNPPPINDDDIPF